MRIARTAADVRAALRDAPGPVGLVPTMGALHDGHLSLIERARAECATVVMSLFVNPTQFAAGEDLDRYPRDESRDARLAEAAGVDLLFAPEPAQMYPPGFATTIVVGGLIETLEGAVRGAEHFHGVATIVAKLFGIVGPQRAYFGQKDAQQALVLRRMALDLDMALEIVVCPTVREPDGLARSSRNAYLSASERSRATALFRALRAAEALIAAGERDAATVARVAQAELDREGIDADYLAIVDPDTLTAVEHVESTVLIAVAARVGATRLIDNVLATPPA